MFRSSSYHPLEGLRHTSMYKTRTNYQLDYLHLSTKNVDLFDNSSMPF